MSAKIEEMREYQRAKEKYPDAIVLVRMGDFYEAFSEDAEAVSKALGLTQTRRSGVPMTGFPHQLNAYIQKLVAAGHHVVVLAWVDGCLEQNEGAQ